LVWKNDFEKIGMIEVYPKATLAANFNKKDFEGYKGKDPAKQENRRRLYDRLKAIYHFECDLAYCDNEHIFDALLCCLAAADFLSGVAIGPSELTDDIKREGWIWVKRKSAT
jgi:hypothetical protein